MNSIMDCCSNGSTFLLQKELGLEKRGRNIGPKDNIIPGGSNIYLLIYCIDGLGFKWFEILGLKINIIVSSQLNFWSNNDQYLKIEY